MTNEETIQKQREAKAHREAVPLALVSAKPSTVYVEARRCENCHHIGLNDSHSSDDVCSECGWAGPAPEEDRCPDCHREGVMWAACPLCRGEYRLLVGASIAQPSPSHEEWQERALALAEVFACTYQHWHKEKTETNSVAFTSARAALIAHLAARPSQAGAVVVEMLSEDECLSAVKDALPADKYVWPAIQRAIVEKIARDTGIPMEVKPQ